MELVAFVILCDCFFCYVWMRVLVQWEAGRTEEHRWHFYIEYQLYVVCD